MLPVFGHRLSENYNSDDDTGQISGGNFKTKSRLCSFLNQNKAKSTFIKEEIENEKNM